MIITYALYLAIVLFVIGIALVLWARFNPRWQYQDAYDALTPALFGAFALIAAAIVTVATGLIWMVQWIMLVRSIG